ncbi:hypothetical protein D6789_04710 [Candidatus Woesearchaeota archaeon]|nr:MAG: hypothetical protein D6789_04710 [Candidatus Woesearchaeota archaeon]
MERIAKKAAGGARVAEPAKEALREAAQEFLAQLSADAWSVAQNANRRTILKQDVLLAQKLRR